MANSPICSIENCGKPAHQRGWCCAHYHRWFRHGDPLKGGTSKGSAIAYFKERVLPYGGDDCLMWPFGDQGKGYPTLTISGKTRTIHRMVCEHINGPSPMHKYEATHTCGNGHIGCVSPTHLRWATHQENMADKIVHGRNNRGERCGHAKLSRHDVRTIRSLAGVMHHKKIAEKFRVSRATVQDAISRRTWAWLD